MLSVLDVVRQDLVQAACTYPVSLEPTPSARTLLETIRDRRGSQQPATSSFHIPSTPLIRTNIELKCGGELDCSSSRRGLMSSLQRAADSSQQLDIIEAIKNENRFFSRIWAKSVGTSEGDQITTGALCQKYTSWLKCIAVVILHASMQLMEVTRRKRRRISPSALYIPQ